MPVSPGQPDSRQKLELESHVSTILCVIRVMSLGACFSLIRKANDEGMFGTIQVVPAPSLVLTNW